MKKIFSLIFLSIFLFSCGAKDSKNDSDQAGDRKIKVGLALGYAGIGDLSFNDMQYNGLIEASRRFDIDITYQVPASDQVEQDMIDALEILASVEKCDLIFTSGSRMIEPLAIVAKKYPNISFVILDDTVEGFPNVTSVVYGQDEGSFLAGVLAAMFSKTGKLGFIGGVDIPVIGEFLIGFEQGTKYVNPSIQIFVEYGTELPDFSGFSDPQKGFEIADKMYKNGCDIVYAVAGETGKGIILAAKENNLYAIGVDADQDYLAPGHVLTSMMKRLDNTVIDLTEDFLNNRLKGDTVILSDLKAGGVSLTDMTHTRDIIGEDILKKLSEVRQDIISGKIQIQ